MLEQRDAGIPTSRNLLVSLPSEAEEGVPISINVYQKLAKATDKLAQSGLELSILGLFGEVGSLLSALKKKQRDKAAFEGYRASVIEELGDSLWYFTNLASRAGLELAVLAQRLFRDIADWDEVQANELTGTFGGLQSQLNVPISEEEFTSRCLTLAGCVGDLLNDFRLGIYAENRDRLSAHLIDIFRSLVAAADAAGVDLDIAVYENLRKIYSRWPISFKYPPRIDEKMRQDERIPSALTFYIAEEHSGSKYYVIQKCNDIIIGDRLTDNKSERDDYRFHDVFHIAFAVHLGWSPVLRALLHLKRKSDPEIDENQDGARAILIEEGVATFIFARGLSRGSFEGIDHVDYDLLKSIQEFVKGFEVERCALWQWERAILDGFHAFRQLHEHRRGWIVADFDHHTMIFRREADEI